MYQEKHPPLNNNQSGSLGRLSNLLRKLIYNDIAIALSKEEIADCQNNEFLCQKINAQYVIP